MRPRRFSIGMVVALVAVILAPASPVAAATTQDCTNQQNRKIYAMKQSVGQSLVGVKADIDKQLMPECNDPLGAVSASSAWVMIQHTPGNNYIQYGFWRCSAWCFFGAGPTNDETHEFIEYNNEVNRWPPLPWRDEPINPNPANGLYSMKLTHIDGTEGGPDYFEMRRGSTFRYQVPDPSSGSNDWRHWSLVGASATYSTETWDPGDQLGGSPNNDLRIINFRWARGAGGYQDLLLANNESCIRENIPGAIAWQYGCSRETTNGLVDGIHVWTNDR